MNNYLRFFNASLRSEKGIYNAPASLICIRTAIQRQLTSLEHSRKVNILNGDDLKKPDGVLEGTVKAFLTSSQEKSGCISIEDLVKLRKYFAIYSISKIFNILFFFPLTGRENLRYLTKDCIDFNVADSRQAAYA